MFDRVGTLAYCPPMQELLIIVVVGLALAVTVSGSIVLISVVLSALTPHIPTPPRDSEE